MIRKKQATTRIHVQDLIFPYFVIEGTHKQEPILSMPGVSRLSIDLLIKNISQAKILGISSILLFGVCPPGQKSDRGSHAHASQNIVARAVKAIKQNFPNLTVITDVCLCAYTTHGHCGILEKRSGKIASEPTLAALSEMALSHAQAGADWVAPSAMAHHQVRAIRRALDHGGFRKTKVLGYSAKFASNFYGPFRDAADSSPKFGDRSGYQLDYADPKKALKEISDDIHEGADMVMVKPALSYLDIIKEARLKFNFPLAAYNVSGEYTLVKHGAQKGLWDERKMVTEILTSIKRAGANQIITYHALDVARWLTSKK